jgi:hypothetical protein
MKHYHFVLELPSKSKPNKTYQVKMDEQGNLTCNCPSWVFNQRKDRTCKHTDVVRNAGFEGSETGRFLVGVDQFSTKMPIFCKNYPDLCDECKLRFECWTAKNPEFEINDLKKAGIVRK